MVDFATDGLRPRLTDVGDATAYFIAQAIRIGATFGVAAAGPLMPLYMWAYRNGGSGGLTSISIVIGAVWAALALALYIVIRGLMGGTPVLISPAPRTIGSRGAEVGAYALAQMVGVAAFTVLNMGGLGQLNGRLRHEGHIGLAIALGVGIGVIAAIVLFGLFIVLRRAFSGGPVRAAVAGPTAAGVRVPAGRPELAGIGGWLIFPAIGCVLGPILSVVFLIVSLNYYEGVTRAGYGGVFTMSLFVQVGMAAFAVWVSVLFFGKKRGLPGAIIGLLVTGLATGVLLLMVSLGAGAEPFVAEQIKSLVFQGISAAIWIPYFTSSERVRMTFVN